MTVLILGQSPHLIRLIERIESTDAITVIPWREINHFKLTTHPRRIYIVGYNYASYSVDFDLFSAQNIEDVKTFLNKINPKDYDVIYINTQINHKKITLSRYRYAKEKLATDLIANQLRTSILRFDTFVNENGFPIVKSGPVGKILFLTLERLGLIKFTSEAEMLTMLSNPSLYSSNSVLTPTPYFLRIPRSQFVDRMLRFLFG
jgi:hypothetical protein